MIRKATVYLVLLSMVVHCASRIGLLSYLYQNRHEISYQIGLIAEIPIAMCSSSYEFDKGLTIHQSDNDESTLPAQLVQAKEITLFFQHSFFDIKSPAVTFISDHLTNVFQKRYTPPAITIFHPPS